MKLLTFIKTFFIPSTLSVILFIFTGINHASHIVYVASKDYIVVISDKYSVHGTDLPVVKEDLNVQKFHTLKSPGKTDAILVHTGNDGIGTYEYKTTTGDTAFLDISVQTLIDFYLDPAIPAPNHDVYRGIVNNTSDWPYNSSNSVAKNAEYLVAGIRDLWKGLRNKSEAEVNLNFLYFDGNGPVNLQCDFGSSEHPDTLCMENRLLERPNGKYLQAVGMLGLMALKYRDVQGIDPRLLEGDGQWSIWLAHMARQCRSRMEVSACVYHVLHPKLTENLHILEELTSARNDLMKYSDAIKHLEIDYKTKHIGLSCAKAIAYQLHHDQMQSMEYPWTTIVDGFNGDYRPPRRWQSSRPNHHPQGFMIDNNLVQYKDYSWSMIWMTKDGSAAKLFSHEYDKVIGAMLGLGQSGGSTSRNLSTIKKHMFDINACHGAIIPHAYTSNGSTISANTPYRYRLGILEGEDPKNEFSATFCGFHDDKELVLKIDVMDDDTVADDEVVLYLWTEHCVGPGKKRSLRANKSKMGGTPKEISIPLTKTHRHKSGKYYEIVHEIPWTDLGCQSVDPGMEFRIDVHVHDGVNTKDTRRLAWWSLETDVRIKKDAMGPALLIRDSHPEE